MTAVVPYEQYRWYCEACGHGEHGFDHPDEASDEARLHNDSYHTSIDAETQNAIALTEMQMREEQG
jgi:hypothetical protein